VAGFELDGSQAYVRVLHGWWDACRYPLQKLEYRRGLLHLAPDVIETGKLPDAQTHQETGLLRLLEQASVLDGNGCLVGEGTQPLQVSFAETAVFP